MAGGRLLTQGGDYELETSSNRRFDGNFRIRSFPDSSPRPESSGRRSPGRPTIGSTEPGFKRTVTGTAQHATTLHDASMQPFPKATVVEDETCLPWAISAVRGATVSVARLAVPSKARKDF